MRRARLLIAVVVAALAATSVLDAAPKRVDVVNGIGIIDYASRPTIKVGAWVSYHMTGTSEMGESDDYEVTILIPSEERFWGEDCFWVETWTEPRGRAARAVATLMSYSIFEDSFPNLRSQYYMRKSVDGIGPDGELAEQLVRRPPSTLKKRGALDEAPSILLDTLGTVAVELLDRTFQCQKVLWQEGKAGTMDQRDSSVTNEVRENRTIFLSKEVPVSGLVQETIEHTIRRKTWAIGRSQEAAPWITMDRATGTAVLTGFGIGGKESRLLPEERRTSLDELDESGRLKPAARRARAAAGKKG